VKLLLDEGKQVTAFTRDPAAAALPHAAHLAGGDPSRPETLTSALVGVEAIFLNPATLGNAIAELLSLAVEQGVRRVVLMSAVTTEYGGGYRRFAERFKAAEDARGEGSGPPRAHLRRRGGRPRFCFPKLTG